MAKKPKQQSAKTEKQPPAKKPLNTVKRRARHVKERLLEQRNDSPHRSFRLTRRSEVPKYQKIPAWWRLVIRSFVLIKTEWKKTVPLLALFVPLAWLVSGVFSQGFMDVKLALNLFDASSLSLWEEAFVLFGGFITSQATSIPQDSLVVLNVLGLIMWLSFIWVARYSYARKTTTVREAVYTSGAAFVPFALLLLLLVIQLLPALAASLIFSSMTGGGFTQTVLETVLFALLGLLLLVLSLYFIVSTVVALQVVALPGMYPWRALRNARKLVAGRRFAVMRKIVMAPVVVLVAWALIFIPVLLLDNAICSDGSACWSTFTIAPLIYYSLVGLTLAFMSVYLYVMYRALLEQEDSYV